MPGHGIGVLGPGARPHARPNRLATPPRLLTPRAGCARCRDPARPRAERSAGAFEPPNPRIYTAGPRGCSSAGRAPAWHVGGQGFESPQLHFSSSQSPRKRPEVGPRGCWVFSGGVFPEAVEAAPSEGPIPRIPPDAQLPTPEPDSNCRAASCVRKAGRWTASMICW